MYNLFTEEINKIALSSNFVKPFTYFELWWLERSGVLFKMLLFKVSFGE